MRIPERTHDRQACETDAESRAIWQRHIHKKVLELPIPKFNPKNESHRNMVELAKTCRTKMAKRLPELSHGYIGIGKIRQLVKEELEPEIAQVDRLVKRILLERGVSTKNLADYV